MTGWRAWLIRLIGGPSYRRLIECIRELIERNEDLTDQCSVLWSKLHPSETVTLEEAKQMLEEDADRMNTP